MIGECNAATANLMNVLWMVGTFTFAIVLGVVSSLSCLLLLMSCGLRVLPVLLKRLLTS